MYDDDNDTTETMWCDTHQINAEITEVHVTDGVVAGRQADRLVHGSPTPG